MSIQGPLTAITCCTQTPPAPGGESPAEYRRTPRTCTKYTRRPTSTRPEQRTTEGVNDGSYSGVRTSQNISRPSGCFTDISEDAEPIVSYRTTPAIMKPDRERAAVCRASSSSELHLHRKGNDAGDDADVRPHDASTVAERPSLQSDRVQTNHHHRSQYLPYRQQKEQLQQQQQQQQKQQHRGIQKHSKTHAGSSQALPSSPREESRPRSSGDGSASAGGAALKVGKTAAAPVAPFSSLLVQKRPGPVAQGYQDGQTHGSIVKPPQSSSASKPAPSSASSLKPIPPNSPTTQGTVTSPSPSNPAAAALGSVNKLSTSAAAAAVASAAAAVAAVSPTASATTHRGHPHAHPSTPTTHHSHVLHEPTLLRKPSSLLLSGHEIKRRYQRSHNQGFFEPTLPSASASTVRTPSPPPAAVAAAADTTPAAATPSSTAMQMQQRAPSTIAAQTAFQHQAEIHNSDQGPLPPIGGTQSSSGTTAPSQQHQQQPPQQLHPSQYQPYNRHLAATAAASLAFPRRPASPAVGALPETVSSGKPAKPEKEKSNKMKLFSKPKHIVMSRDKDRDKDKDKERDKDREKDDKNRTLPSPGYPGTSGLSKVMNSSSVSVNEPTGNQLSNTSFYNLSTSSVNTVVPAQERKASTDKDRDITTAGSATSLATHNYGFISAKEKDSKHKHHFLSRPKLKLKDKDDHYNLPLSSAASNSMPMDPNAPQSLYSFAPSSPSNIGFGKSLDLRHGGRSWREKKKEEKEKNAAQDAALREDAMDWAGMGIKAGEGGPPSYGSAGGGVHGIGHLGHGHGLYGTDVSLKETLSGFGLNNMAPEDAWDYLKAKLLVLFEGEDIRIALEDLNRLVSIHLQCCMQRHSPGSIIDDLRDLLQTGFDSLSHGLGHHLQDDTACSRGGRDRVVPHLAQMWLFVFGNVLPFLQAVFLPLDIEFKGRGSIVPRREARDTWAAKTADLTNAASNRFANTGASTTPTGVMAPGAPLNHFTNDTSINYDDELDIRAIVLIYFRDKVILSRYETLLATFSRLSLESMNANMSVNTMGSSNSSLRRPSTASVLDPGFGGYTTSKPASILAVERGPPGSSGGGHQYTDSGGFNSASRTRATSSASSNPEFCVPSSASSSHSPSRGSMLYTTLPAGGSSTTLASVGSTPLAHYGGVADPILLITETVARMLQCISVLASVHTDNEAQKQIEELSKALKHNWLGRARTGRDRRGFIGAKVTSTKPKPPLPRLDSAGSRVTGTPPPIEHDMHAYAAPPRSPRRWSQCSPMTTQFTHLHLQQSHEPGYFDPHAHAHTISEPDSARNLSPPQNRRSSDRRSNDFPKPQPRGSIDSDRSGRPSYHRHRYYQQTGDSIDDVGDE